MTEIERALADIGTMRESLARQDSFCAYGPATIAATGVMALGVATYQFLTDVDALASPEAFFGTWIAAAVVSVAMVGAEAATRSRRMHSRLADTMILAAARDFVPAGAAGVGLLAVFARHDQTSLWLLPGLWQMLVAMAMFAASKSLPRNVAYAGGWYMATGLATLTLGSVLHATSPWAMGLPFATGQLLVAYLVHDSLKVVR